LLETIFKFDLQNRNRTETGLHPSQQLKDIGRNEQRVQLAAAGSHQKSPILSDGANEEWETASETSDHGDDFNNKQKPLERSVEASGDRLERPPRRGGKLTYNIRPSKSGLLAGRKMGKPQRGECRKADMGRNKKAASETPITSGGAGPEDIIQQKNPLERQHRKPTAITTTATTSQNQYKQRIAGQKNVNPASHTNQSSYEVICLSINMGFGPNDVGHF
jgi:hypothetical protein